MKDIMEISHEAHKAANGNPLKHQELFTEMLFAELIKMKSADIAPHLTCDFDVLKREYNVSLRFPFSVCKPYSVVCDIK